MARVFAIVTVSIWMAAVATAQEPLTLDKAVAAALASNPSLRAAQAASDEAVARAPEARAALLPRVSFSESWQRGNQPVFVFSSLLSSRQFAAANFAIDSLNHPDPTGFFRASVGAEQLIFDGGRARSTANASDLERDIAQIAVRQAAADLAVDVTRAFGRMLTAEALRGAADAALATAREDQARAERRRDVGTATDADVLSLSSRVADLRQRVIQADADAAIASAELSRLMGQPVDRAYTIAAPAVASADEAPALDGLLAEADAHRPEILRAQAAQRVAAAQRQAARSALYPHIAAQAAMDWSGTRFNDRASAWIIGGEFRWTLSASGSEFAERKAAAAAASRAAAQLEDARAAVHVDVIAALRVRQSARARQDVGRAAVDQARESERVIRNRFDAGMAGVTDVLRASTAVLDAEASQTAALVDVIVGDALLRRALGRTP